LANGAIPAERTERRQPARRLSTRRNQVLPLLLILGGGIVLSLLGFLAIRHWERHDVNASTTLHFQQDAHDLSSAIQREAQSHLLVLRALGALYTASERVTDTEFQQFAHPLLDRITSLQALEWIPRVPDAERSQHEARHRRLDFSPNYQINERNEQGLLVPAATRDEYYPVDIVAPLPGNRSALGFDLASEAVRREALERARDSGTIAISGPISLVQDPSSPTERNHAFLAYLPLYRKGTTIDSRDARRRQLLGFVLTVSRVHDLIESAVAQSSHRGIDLTVIDSTQPDQPQHLYGHDGLTDKLTPSPLPTGLYSDQTLDIGGRQWHILAVPAPGQYQNPMLYSAWLALSTGLLLTVLLAWYVRALQCYSDKLRRLNRSHEIRSHSYRHLVQAIDEQALLDAFCRVLVEVADYRFVWVGYTEPDLPPTQTTGTTSIDSERGAPQPHSATVRVMASAGTMVSSDEPHPTTCCSDHEQPSTCSVAIQSGQPQILTDIGDPRRFVLWRKSALRHGYRSMIALPLTTGEQTFGNLNLFAADPNPFDPEEVRLLQDLATDLALGIVTLRTREAHKQQVRHLREQVELEERERLAATLHDGVGQSVQAVNLGLKRLRTLTDPSQTAATGLLATMIAEQATIIADLRDISHDLRPLFTRNWDLRDAIRQQCLDFSQRSTVPIELNIGERPCRLPQRIQEQCFLIFREALNNALNHAQAKRIDVTVTYRDDSALHITITDDGIGFDPNGDFQHPSGLGLSMMAERASSIGGHTQIDSADGHGTRIILSIPTTGTGTGTPAQTTR